MKISFPLDPARPKVPELKGHQRELPDADYYLTTQVSSMLRTYSGKGRGLELKFSKVVSERLKSLKELFGDGFGLNEIIIFSYNMHLRYPDKFKSVDAQGDTGKKLTQKFKPSESALTVILKFGADDAASTLFASGVNMLHDKFFKEGIDE